MMIMKSIWSVRQSVPNWSPCLESESVVLLIKPVESYVFVNPTKLNSNCSEFK